jgi:hypothetical protein
MPGTPEAPEGAQWMNHMRAGDWEAAWQISDRQVRRRSPHEQLSQPRHLQSIWNGTPLHLQRVLVRCYHGMGDTVQFIRFMQPLRQIASEVIVWCQPQLIPLLRTARGIDSLLPLHDGLVAAEYDVDIELMEVPHALRTTLDTLPDKVPYFDVGHICTRKSDNQSFRVGIVWQAGTWDRRRSISPRLIEEMMQVPGVHWQIFQRGPALAAWRGRSGEVPQLHGILEEARAMLTLDLLISVDTLSAHLAGALGVPTWTLLPLEADWRWMNGRNDSPWYPTMKLFRQRARGDWRSVLEQVSGSLRRLLRNRQLLRDRPALE